MTSIAQVASIVTRLSYAIQTAQETPDIGTSGPWRPPEWSNKKASLTLTAKDATGKSTAYVFDTIIRTNHERRAVTTKNPIQTGAAVTDHIYIVPARLVIEVAMSDSMTSFTLGQFSDSSSRSTSAYLTLVSLMNQRGTVSVSTRLQQYDNMAITGIESSEDVKNAYGLRARVTLEELLFASVESTNSNITMGSPTSDPGVPQVTTGTTAGPVQPAAATPALESQYNVSGSSLTASSIGAVSGAGAWSSLNVSSLNV